MRKYLLDNFTLYNLLFDGLIIVGAFVFKWDAARIIAFYWLDTCAASLFYILYIRSLGYLRLPFKFVVACSIAIGVLQIYLMMIADLSLYTSTHQSIPILERLFKPYYEISFFLTFSFISQINFYRRIKKLKNENEDHDLMPFIHTNIILQLLSIPCMLLLVTIIFAMTINTTVSIIISFIVLRNVLEKWRHNRLIFYRLG